MYCNNYNALLKFLAYWPDFSKVPDNATTTYGLPYDYTSVMHYPRYAFSKNGKETIVCKVRKHFFTFVWSLRIIQSSILSEGKLVH